MSPSGSRRYGEDIKMEMDMPWFVIVSIGGFLFMFCAGTWLGWQKDEVLPSFVTIAVLLTACGYFLGFGARIIKNYFF